MLNRQQSTDYYLNSEFSEHENLPLYSISNYSSSNGSVTQGTIQGQGTQIELLVTDENPLLENKSDLLLSQIVTLRTQLEFQKCLFNRKKLELESNLKEKEDQLREREQTLAELWRTISIQEQRIRILTDQLDLTLAQKLEQEERCEYAQQEINNLKEKFEREKELHRDKENALFDSEKNVQELVQKIEDLDCQKAQLEEGINLAAVQQLHR